MILVVKLLVRLLVILLLIGTIFFTPKIVEGKADKKAVDLKETPRTCDTSN